MTTFQAIQLSCPFFKKPMGHYELTSYFVNSSTVFSDGKVEHEGSYFEDKSILVCPFCEEPFWRDEATEKELQYTDNQNELPFSNSLLDLELTLKEEFPQGIISLYKELLDKGFANNIGREVYLRIHLWRSINDIIRSQRPLLKTIDGYLLKNPIQFIKRRIQSNSTFDKYNQLHTDNLQRLINIFKPNDENEQLLQAEMYREMGKRKEALLLLNNINPTSKKQIQKIRRATLLFKKQVFKLS